MPSKLVFVGNRFLLFLYLFGMAGIFVAGYRLRPEAITLPQKQAKQMHYDTQGAMLKVVADLTMRRIRLAEGESRIFKIDNQPVLVKRELAKAKPPAIPTAVYLVEGARPDDEQRDEFQRLQCGLIDLEPEAAFGKMQVAFWRNRTQRRTNG